VRRERWACIWTLPTVAQNCILLYRGFAIRWPQPVRRYSPIASAAECNSAIQQITNLRYAKGAFTGEVSGCPPRWRDGKINVCFTFSSQHGIS
jgi:hypothetical protein